MFGLLQLLCTGPPSYHAVTDRLAGTDVQTPSATVAVGPEYLAFQQVFGGSRGACLRTRSTLVAPIAIDSNTSQAESLEEFDNPEK